MADGAGSAPASVGGSGRSTPGMDSAAGATPLTPDGGGVGVGEMQFGRVVPPGAPPRTMEDLVAETAADYAPYVEIGDNEHLQTAMAVVAEDVNHSLARLEEFHGVVRQISSETDTFLRECVPLLQENCEQLRATYDRITQLEAFVALVKRNVQQMDDQVTAVERGYALQPLRAAKDAITGKLTSLLKLSSSGAAGAGSFGDTGSPAGGGSPATQRRARGPVAPPTVFRAADYFVKPGMSPGPPSTPASPSGAGAGTKTQAQLATTTDS